jgi:1-acyl-sn-glycerol-3-phosphate acyltransferase
MADEKVNTSDYWRKVLRADEGVGGDALAQFKYPHRFLRPLFYLILNLLSKLYWRIEVSGLENLPASPPYVVAPNHVSSLDYPVVAWAMGRVRRRDLYVLATKFFYDNPFTRFFMKVGANVQRIDVDEDFFTGVRIAVKVLKSGKSIYINPEGTRSRSGELLPFRPGVGMLACELDVPIVPVYIHGILKCLPVGSVFPRPGRISVNFGKPLQMGEYRSRLKGEGAYYVYKEITEELRRRIIEMQDKFGSASS